ncbi:hypothetical protein [Formosa sediminum]|nr:hypothetical protein [Formosa sediminum]
MARNKRKGIQYPKQFMKTMKKIKRKRMRNFPLQTPIKEQEFNTASMVL